MDRLYTPWRYDYVSGGPAGDGCVFCDCLESGDDAVEHVLHRSRHWYVILNRFPYNSGHLLLVLNRHAGSLIDCTAEELADLSPLLQAMETALRRAYDPGGVNCGYNGGAGAGAGIPDHFHVHMLPRWRGDTNFMTVVGDTRIMPRTLAQTDADLRPLLAELLEGAGL